MNENYREHTLKRYDDELDKLKQRMLTMGQRAVDQIESALAIFTSRDLVAARQIVAGDEDFDRMEVEADDLTIKLIARLAPVASDLRCVLALSKCFGDLERIADEAARIAGAAIDLFGPERRIPKGPLVCDVHKIGAMTVKSLQSALHLFEAWSEADARAVIARHREMDDQLKGDLRCLMTYVMEDCRTVGFAVGVIEVIKSLDRIGHYACNIAEHSIYKMTGKDVRLYTI